MGMEWNMDGSLGKVKYRALYGANNLLCFAKDKICTYTKQDILDAPVKSAHGDQEAKLDEALHW